MSANSVNFNSFRAEPQPVGFSNPIISVISEVFNEHYQHQSYGDIRREVARILRELDDEGLTPSEVIQEFLFQVDERCPLAGEVETIFADSRFDAFEHPLFQAIQNGEELGFILAELNDYRLFSLKTGQTPLYAAYLAGNWNAVRQIIYAWKEHPEPIEKDLNLIFYSLMKDFNLDVLETILEEPIDLKNFVLSIDFDPEVIRMRNDVQKSRWGSLVRRMLKLGAEIPNLCRSSPEYISKFSVFEFPELQDLLSIITHSRKWSLDEIERIFLNTPPDVYSQFFNRWLTQEGALAKVMQCRNADLIGAILRTVDSYFLQTESLLPLLFQRGSLAHFKLAFERGLLPIGIRLEKGNTLLHQAIVAKKFEVAEWLVRQGLSLTKKNEDRVSPFELLLLHSPLNFNEAIAACRAKGFKDKRIGQAILEFLNDARDDDGIPTFTDRAIPPQVLLEALEMGSRFHRFPTVRAITTLPRTGHPFPLFNWRKQNQADLEAGAILAGNEERCFASKEAMDEVFHEIKSTLPMRHISDGCHERGVWTAHILSLLGYQTNRLEVRSPPLQLGKVTWKAHSAIGVYLGSPSPENLWVFDPIFEVPVTQEQWLKAIRGQNSEEKGFNQYATFENAMRTLRRNYLFEILNPEPFDEAELIHWTYPMPDSCDF